MLRGSNADGGRNILTWAHRCFSALTLGFVLLGSSGCLIDRIGGAYTREPGELESNASIGAKRLVELAYEGIDPARLVDYHTHIIGLGADNSGAFVSPRTKDWLSLERWKFLIYTSASGIKNLAQADQEYVARLARLARSSLRGGKYRLLAVDN